ncbi:MAG: SH3 domain-containing protein [Desulfovibrio sp.]|nr:SH3 domain-containing protein [Desulfovibrio sp.]
MTPPACPPAPAPVRFPARAAWGPSALGRPPALPSLRFLVLALSLLVCACAKSGGDYTGPACLDVITLPQDLSVYAGAASARPLVAHEAQTAAAARQKEIFYGPWRRTRPTPGLRAQLRGDFNMRPEPGYIDGHSRFPAELWRELKENGNEPAFGQNAGPGITLRDTDMRAMPSARPYYLRPDLPGEGYPFDYFQLTSLPPGTPIYISNVSRDGAWMLAECPAASGWLPTKDVARVDEPFMREWQSLPLAAVLRDKTRIGESEVGIGALLPIAGEREAGISLYYPVTSGEGKAEKVRRALPAGAAAPVPLRLDAANVARIGNGMTGQAYTWGGLDGGRDCSALTRDLFAPFGIWLPRNSASQAGAGNSIAGLSAGQKKEAIRSAPPFRTLLWLRGHIALYLGEYRGRGLIFHNIWGLRTKDASGGCEGRAVIGRAVVTSLEPGLERPDLCPPGTILERMEKILILPAPGQD